MNYRHLHYFWMVAMEGGISAAARKLGMTPQAISSQISTLEQQVGQVLFTQVGRKLELTEAGRTALHYAERIFQLGEELEHALEQGGASRSRLNVGVSDAIPKTIAQQLLAPLGAATTRLVCIDGDRDELIARLALHQLDLVLCDRAGSTTEALKLQSKLLVFAPIMLLGTAELVAQYRDGFPFNLSGAPLLLPTRNAALRAQIDVWLAENRIVPDIVGEFSDSALMAAFAQRGAGFFPSPVLAEGAGTTAGLQTLGHLPGVIGHYHVIFSARKIMHPALAQLLELESQAA